MLANITENTNLLKSCLKTIIEYWEETKNPLLIIIPVVVLALLIFLIIKIKKDKKREKQPSSMLNIRDSADGKTYKTLSKEQRSCLLSQGIALSFPGSFFGWFFLSVYPMLLFDAIYLHETHHFVSIAVATGVILVSYVLGNLFEEGFLHQLITNTCKITVETVLAIDIRANERRGFGRTTIQYVTTDNNSDVPTLYRDVSKAITIDSEIFIIQMKNGKKYALTTKKRSKKGIFAS